LGFFTLALGGIFGLLAVSDFFVVSVV